MVHALIALLRPVADFTTKDITCNQGGNIPAKLSVPVVPGDKVYAFSHPNSVAL
jgi:hypothetical protein